MNTIGPAYTYSALVTDVHDGDTFTATISLGLFVCIEKQHIRLLGLNAPELKTPEGTDNGPGKIAHAALARIIRTSRGKIVVTTYKPNDLTKEKIWPVACGDLRVGPSRRGF